MKENDMKKYRLYSGLGGGFGGAVYQETVECATQEEANDAAYELACQDYESYAGTNGIRDFAEIMEEEDCSEEEAEQIYNDDRDSWIEYWAEEEIEGKEYDD